jgi:N-acetylmuramoyl-L-alanine amidase
MGVDPDGDGFACSWDPRPFRTACSEPDPPVAELRGPAGGRVDLVVLHYTAMPTAPLRWSGLCDPEAEVSAHYLIDADGTLLSLVDEGARAWHAGAGTWAGGGT